MKTISNYVSYHTHTDYSLLDSVTPYQDFINLAKELGQTAICFSEHGNTRGWVAKKMACDAAGLKYLHGVEIYLTATHSEKVRDNYHTILIAKNQQGVLELNKLVSMSDDDDHKYYTGRLSFDEFLDISPNIIKISACLASPLNKLPVDHPYYERLVQKYDYLEIQPHNCEDQISYNRHLAQLAERYHKPLIAGTDAHSLNQYHAECRSLLMSAKKKSYGDEDQFDLTYKSYDQLIDAFRTQDALPEAVWMQAIENTNVMADSVEDFELDISLKYPILNGSAKADEEAFVKNCWDSLARKLKDGVIPIEQAEAFRAAIKEELRVFCKLGMAGFMQSMSEIIRWCHDNGIVTGPARGSVGGSRAAYVTDIIDLNPEQWHTVFSRFCNEDRREVGDIDVDVIFEDRPRIFDYIINRFGREKTAFVQDRACIEEIIRGHRHRWQKEHENDPEVIKYEELVKEDKKKYKRITAATKALDPNPYSLNFTDEVKAAYGADPEKCKKKYKEVFYFFDGFLDTKVSQGVHPAGIVISPVTLADNYGVFHKDGGVVLQIDMEEIHEVSLVKYDMLALRNVKVIRDACEMAGIPYIKSYQMDFNDQNVWADMMRSPVGVFQMEGDFAFKLLKDFQTKSIFDMSLVTACIRPSGGSYRNQLIAKVPHKNPSELLDKLLADNYGYLVYQEDTIKFLQEICGFSGSEADNIRRAIGRKDKERLNAALPQILDGYCSKSDQPRNVAEEEAKEFIQILEDSASYQFGYNHSIAYCLVGYYCAWLRYYYPMEFITSCLNNAANEADIRGGTDLARVYGIRITAPRFGSSGSHYMFDKENGIISKGVASVKYMNSIVPDELYNLYHSQKFNSFMDVLSAIVSKTSCDSRQLQNLIRIGYFSEFGNWRELQRIYDAFEYFKEGEAKTFRKEGMKDGPLTEIIKGHSTDKNDKGKELKSYTVTDMPGLLSEVEQYIRDLHIPDADFRSKMSDQKELMGYIDMTTGKPEDRRKLIVLDKFELSGVNGVWGVAVTTRSIGTGNEARLTIRKSVYDRTPVKKLDVIYGASLSKNDKGYWYLNDYRKLV